MLLTRCVGRQSSQATACSSSSRSYSYFSQRPGKFFTSVRYGGGAHAGTNGNARANRVANRASQSTQHHTPQPTSSALTSKDGDVNAVSQVAKSGVDQTPAAVSVQGSSSSVTSSSTSTSTAENQRSRVSNDRRSAGSGKGGQSPSDPRASSSAPVPPFHHPQPLLPNLHLHQFFSEHRPMLLLNHPVNNLFRRSPVAFLDAVSPSSLSSSPSLQSSPSFDTNAATQDEFQAFRDILGATATLDHDKMIELAASLGSKETNIFNTADDEADADIARLLAKHMVQHRIEASRDFSTALEKLGLKDDIAEGLEEARLKVARPGFKRNSRLSMRDFAIYADSVKRKRRKKMNKHKYKKRRKAQRALRQKLGK